MNNTSVSMLRKLTRRTALCTALLGLAAVPTWAVTVNFTVDGDRNHYVGAWGTVPGEWRVGSVLESGSHLTAVTIPITVTKYGTTTVPNQPSLMFCTDIPKSIYLGASYPGAYGSYEAVPLYQAGALSYGKYPESDGIGAGGIGAAKATMLQLLFDQHYLGVSYSDWSPDEAAAMSLAVWKLSHEPLTGSGASAAYANQNLNLGAFDATGIHFGYYSSGAGISPFTVPGYFTLAQSWIDDAVSDYKSLKGAPYTPRIDVYTLTSSNGQDITGFAAGAGYVSPVPEPLTFSLVTGLGLVGFAFWRARRIW